MIFGKPNLSFGDVFFFAQMAVDVLAIAAKVAAWDDAAFWFDGGSLGEWSVLPSPPL
jgi:hypothetical protein